MKNKTIQLLIINSTLILCLYSPFISAKADSIQPTKPSFFVVEANNLRYQYPDSAIQMLQICYDYAIEIADTTMAIHALTKLAQVYGHQARYKESYDRLWTALFFADAAKLELTQSSIYKSIGRYYSFYNRKEDALNYLGISLDIKKKLVERKELDKGRLVDNYHAICATYRELNEPELGKIYLDSSFLFHDPSTSIINYSFLKFEEAVLLSQDGKYVEALKIFKSILPWFSENTPTYQVLIYYYMGESYKQIAKYLESEECFKNALEISKTYNSHIDFTPLVHEKMADLYFSRGYAEKGYERLKKGKELDKVFFDSRSENNRPLLEIQDKFRKGKEEQMKLIREQRLMQLEQEDKILLLQRTILLGSLIFLVLIGLIYFNHVKAKYKAEKQLEVQKNNQIIELKNKKLAASILKLIEKENLIDTLKDKLSQGEGNINRHEIIQFVGSMSSSSSENWKEFDARFVAVNKDFYNILDREFPQLTQGDQRLCALVKLNLSSKEMAKLLRISVESVHTTRHRLRKKLNLSRDKNLKEFIASIGRNPAKR